MPSKEMNPVEDILEKSLKPKKMKPSEMMKIIAMSLLGSIKEKIKSLNFTKKSSLLKMLN